MLSSQPPGTTLIYGHEGTSHNTVTSTPRLNNSVSKCPDSVMFLVVVLRRGRMRHSFNPLGGHGSGPGNTLRSEGGQCADDLGKNSSQGGQGDMRLALSCSPLTFELLPQMSRSEPCPLAGMVQ